MKNNDLWDDDDFFPSKGKIAFLGIVNLIISIALFLGAVAVIAYLIKKAIS